MTTVVFELPLLGGSGNHREQFSALDRIVSANPDKLIIKLMGPRRSQLRKLSSHTTTCSARSLTWD
jgi:hypothetical protein